jgi:hypothetical protein
MSDQDDVTAHHPDLRELPKDQGLACFLDHGRICGADCMAFSTTRPEGQDYVAQQWAQCMILTNFHKVGKHSHIIATELVRKNRDDARKQPPPPLPNMPPVPGR